LAAQPFKYINLKNNDQGNVTVELQGMWVIESDIGNITYIIQELQQFAQIQSITFDCQNLDQWDSRLPSYLLKITDFAQVNNIEIDLTALPDGVQGLLKLARAVPERAGSRRIRSRNSFLANVGNAVINIFNDSTGLIRFIGETQLAILAMVKGKASFRATDILLFIQQAGPEALAIVTLISLLVGLILAFVGAIQLAMFGAQIFIADLVGLGTVREMGALMTAVIMSGRTGAAYAAQLGTMNVNSEIDAIKTMGISPMEFLVLPRMLALILMMPLLCLYADFVGIIGGALVTISAFDVSLIQYYNETCKAVHLPDFSIGIFKSIIFAVLIATAGCMRGMQCGRSASAVGDAATAAVVNSIVYIVVADSVITLICNRLGI
jgi:phospholipid/cholesterol/gamma-HCH transport system permease protein